ncbi:Zinc finger X-linked protein ZXDB [Camelus dromedarius]|uniref:Zinc finger X-linked protein ZXDB n=1 Tax=Camelus dromedarius TaxID=9838 RepID=A0A5N4C416_CAMDR|nr:Zinc finger X-linked protein ZXDB [Camelus dromedarius]
MQTGGGGTDRCRSQAETGPRALCLHRPKATCWLFLQRREQGSSYSHHLSQVCSSMERWGVGMRFVYSPRQRGPFCSWLLCGPVPPRQTSKMLVLPFLRLLSCTHGKGGLALACCLPSQWRGPEKERDSLRLGSKLGFEWTRGSLRHPAQDRAGTGWRRGARCGSAAPGDCTEATQRVMTWCTVHSIIPGEKGHTPIMKNQRKVSVEERMVSTQSTHVLWTWHQVGWVRNRVHAGDGNPEAAPGSRDATGRRRWQPGVAARSRRPPRAPPAAPGPPRWRAWRRREEARAASPARPGPEPVGQRPITRWRRWRRWRGGVVGGSCGGAAAAAIDFFLVLLDPVGGDVETAGAGQAAGPVWREEAGLGPRLQGDESGANPEGRPCLGPVACPLSLPSPGAGPRGGLRGHRHYSQPNLLLRFENGVLTWPRPHRQPGSWVACPGSRGLMSASGDQHAAQPGDCPELPPDSCWRSGPNPRPPLSPRRKLRGPGCCWRSPRGPGGPGQGVVLYLCPEAQAPAKGAPADAQQQPGPGPFKCPLGGCGWTFTPPTSSKHLQGLWQELHHLVYNLKAHEGPRAGEELFKCEVCEETFPTQAKLTLSERPYQCAVFCCKKTLYTVSACFLITAPTSGNRTLSCSFPGCSKQYDKACRSENSPSEPHRRERPFLVLSFEGCGWNFTSMSKLLRHKRKHDDDRRFMCPVEGCGKSLQGPNT